MRNYLKWSLGYSINLILANATLNFRKLSRQLLDYLLLFLMADQGRLFRKILKRGGTYVDRGYGQIKCAKV